MLVVSVSHEGSGTVAISEAGARVIRRHSYDQKKKSFSSSFGTGPPKV